MQMNCGNSRRARDEFVRIYRLVSIHQVPTLSQVCTKCSSALAHLFLRESEVTDAM